MQVGSFLSGLICISLFYHSSGVDAEKKSTQEQVTCAVYLVADQDRSTDWPFVDAAFNQSCAPRSSFERPFFLHKIDHWILRAKMAQSQQMNSGWLCEWCRVMNGKHAFHCHRCGERWDSAEGAYGPTISGKTGVAEILVSSMDNTISKANGQSRPSARARAKQKGKSPRRSKQPDKKADTLRQKEPESQQLQRAPTSAPGTTWMQAAQQLTAPEAPTASPTQQVQTPAATLPPEYKGLIESLKRNQSKGTLPEDVQQEMKTLKVKGEKDKECSKLKLSKG